MAPRSIAGLFVILVFSCAEGQSQTKEGVEIEIITPPSIDCQGIKKGDWVSILFNITDAEGGFIESTYNKGKENKTIPEEYYFAVGSKNGVTVGLGGACKGEKRRLKMPSSFFYEEDIGIIVYDAMVSDHVLAEDKHRLLDFWSMDWNSDRYVDLEEIDMALNRDEALKTLLQDSFGVENMSDMLMGMFDTDDDEALDRDEFFLMHTSIKPEVHTDKEEEEDETKVKKDKRRRRQQKVEL